MKVFQIVVLAFLVLALVYGAGFLATGGNLAIYRYWFPSRPTPSGKYS